MNQTTSPKEGLLLIDKPKGKSSFYLIKILRAITRIKKIGHAGTLDPFATGVMILLIGKSYTKQSNTFLNHDKKYRVTLCLGYKSDTYDSDGIIEKVSDEIPSLSLISNALEKYQGHILQIPPMFSAKKVKGKKLYELARQGQTITRDPVKIHLTTTLVSYQYPYLTLDVTCSKGTYIRSIAHDLGQDLKIGAYAKELIRVQSGPYTIDQCVDFNELTNSEFDYTKHLIGHVDADSKLFQGNQVT